jgi:hypothetical protein
MQKEITIIFAIRVEVVIPRHHEKKLIHSPITMRREIPSTQTTRGAVRTKTFRACEPVAASTCRADLKHARDQQAEAPATKTPKKKETCRADLKHARDQQAEAPATKTTTISVIWCSPSL